jgi:DNA modification methylase
VAFALQDAGWYLRQEIIWRKPTPAAEGRASASRFTRAHESLFMLTKKYRYKFKDDRRLRSVWDIEPATGNGLHFATFPDELPRRCIEVASSVGDTVLDPFHGSGTTGRVAESMGRNWVACELYSKYAPLQQARTAQAALAI